MTFTALVMLVCGVHATPELPYQILGTANARAVPPELVLAVVHTESRCDANAHGSSDDRGLMQIIPRWHQNRMSKLNAEDLYEPMGNLRVGIDYLVTLGVHYEPLQALAHYNGGNHPSARSYQYANTVLKKYYEYKDKTNESHKATK